MDRINTTEKEYSIARGKVTSNKKEWERVVSSAERLVSNPGGDVWKKPEHYVSDKKVLLDKGPIRPSATDSAGKNTDPKTEGLNVVCAAFVYQMTKDERYLKAVQQALKLQMSETVMNFADPAIWKPFLINDINPGFIAAEWVNRYLKAYADTYEHYSEEEHADYDKKFKAAGHFFSNEVNHSINQLFVNRANGDYTLKLGTKGTGEFLFDGGPEIYGISKFYNNRRATMMKEAAYVGAFYKDEILMDSCEKFFKEWLRFGVYPNGMLGENERASALSQESGFAYSMGQLCVMVEIADVLYRAGRKDLIHFETSEGHETTKGGPKSLYKCAQAYLNMFNGTLKVTAYGELLNGIEVDRNWYSVQDVVLASNLCLYFNDPLFKEAYTRKDRGFPSNPAGNGAVPAYMGAGGTLASYLLIKAGLDGRINEMLNPDSTLEELKSKVPGSENAGTIEEILNIIAANIRKEVEIVIENARKEAKEEGIIEGVVKGKELRDKELIEFLSK